MEKNNKGTKEADKTEMLKADNEQNVKNESVGDVKKDKSEDCEQKSKKIGQATRMSAAKKVRLRRILLAAAVVVCAVVGVSTYLLCQNTNEAEIVLSIVSEDSVTIPVEESTTFSYTVNCEDVVSWCVPSNEKIFTSTTDASSPQTLYLTSHTVGDATLTINVQHGKTFAQKTVDVFVVDKSDSSEVEEPQEPEEGSEATDLAELVAGLDEDESGDVFTIYVNNATFNGEKIEVSTSSQITILAYCSSLKAYIIDDNDEIVCELTCSAYAFGGIRTVNVSSTYADNSLLLIGENTSSQKAYRLFSLV